MFRAFWKISVLGLIAAVSACGGGGGSDGDKDCGDFAYQEDAQAWHASHPGAGLDGDHDGLACESLPHKPSGSSGGGGSSTSLQSVVIFDVGGKVSYVQRQAGNYTVSYRSLDSSGGFSANGSPLSGGGFALDSISGREYVLSFGGPEGWPAHNVRFNETAYAWPAANFSGGLASSLGGTYNFMGKRCSPTCSSAFGQLSVDISGRSLSVCPGGPVSTCGGAIQQYALTSTTGNIPGVFSFSGTNGSGGFIVFGNSAQGALGFSMQSQDGSKTTAFIGRISSNYRLDSGSAAIFHSIGSSGITTNFLGGYLATGAIYDWPLPGFFGVTGNSFALNMTTTSPSRVITYDGTGYVFWLN